MDKQYYASLKTKEEKLVYMDIIRKCRKQEWDADNTEKTFAYRRATTLRRCMQRTSVPTKKTIDKYKFTVEELKPIFDGLWTNRFGGGQSGSGDDGSSDKEDTA